MLHFTVSQCYTFLMHILFLSQFPLYTMMVFDEWRQGIPVAWILTSRCAETDLTPWMRAVNARMRSANPGWEPSAFIVDCAQGEINALKLVVTLLL